jgi:hypothetical protein
MVLIGVGFGAEKGRGEEGKGVSRERGETGTRRGFGNRNRGVKQPGIQEQIATIMKRIWKKFCEWICRLVGVGGREV